MSLKYSREVDGLRAVAVLSVLFFHAMPGTFRGGFTGVDVFFVISGFLISGIIWDGLEAGRFTFAGFYEKRVRRIVPALAVVLLVVTAVVWFLYLTPDVAAMGRTLAAAALSGANVVFWQEGGYFGAASDVKPLLHTWSLAVEEQFYLVYPPLLLLVHRRWRAHATKILCIAAALSLAAAFWASYAKPTPAFYLAPFRAWELLMGGLLSVAHVPAVESRAKRETLAAIAWVMVLGSVAWVNDGTTFPAPGAIPCALGTAILIHVSRSGHTSACAPLRSKFAVGVGLISYSLYLWHWPLFAVARYASVPRATPALIAGCSLGAVALAALTWKFVEQPARAPASRMSRRTILVAGAGVLVGLAALGVALNLWTGDVRAKLGSPLGSPRVERMAAAAQDRDPNTQRHLCGSWGRIAPADSPTYGASVAARTAVWGDSHGAALLPGIVAAAQRHGQSLRFFGQVGMPPLIDAQVAGGPGARDGAAYSEEVAQFLERESSLETVVLAGRWASYVYGPNSDFGVEPGADAASSVTLRDAASNAPPIDLLARALHATVARLRRAGKRVFVVGPVPEFGIEVPRALALTTARGDDPERFVLPAAVFDARQSAVLRLLDAERGDGVLRVNPHEPLRRSEGYASIVGDAPLYCDDDHLSLVGAAIVSPVFDVVFEDAR